MTTTLGIAVPLYIMYATKIHSKNDFHAELSRTLNVLIPKPLGNINMVTKANIHSSYNWTTFTELLSEFWKRFC